MLDFYIASDAGALSYVLSHSYVAGVMRLLPDVYWLFGFHYAAYSLLMEFVVNPYVKRGSVVVAISALFGGLSGAQLDLLSGVIGLISGLVVGVLLMVLYHHGRQPVGKNP